MGGVPFGYERKGVLEFLATQLKIDIKGHHLGLY